MQNIIKLPVPQKSGGISLTTVLSKRRSIRDFLTEELNLAEIGQILWAAQGITDEKDGLRTAPSAGALYPLEIYVAKKDGLFHYIPQNHTIILLDEKDPRPRLRGAALDQMFIEIAPVVFAITCIYERTTGKYRERGFRYVHMDAGHAAQNIHLQAVALGFGSVPVGAFHDAEVTRVFKLQENEKPLYLIAVGKPKLKYNREII